MKTAHWNKPGLWEQGTTATAWIRNGVGTARLRIKDETVFETHGGEFNTRTEWDDEDAGIVDLAVILSIEAYERGEVDLSRYICGGFNTATILEDKPSVELPASVMYESRQMLEELEAGHKLCLESIEELQQPSDPEDPLAPLMPASMFETKRAAGEQLELFG